jgi:beta-lactamase superfamily II metal-dependent hydrolase
MDTLRVRVYNVEFGDAIFVSVPDCDDTGNVVMRHILIDCGNALIQSMGGGDEVFRVVIEDILKTLGGKPLDLYVMTHEHMDHIQGLPYSESNFYNSTEDELRSLLKTRFAWLTCCAAKDYYSDEKHPKASKHHLESMELYSKVDRYLNMLQATDEPLSQEFMLLWKNNNPRKTADCVNYLRGLAEQTFYVYRGFDVKNAHPFNEAKFEIWAPEEDNADYFDKPTPHSIALEATAGLNKNREKNGFADCKPLAGVDGSAFYNLVNMRKIAFESLLMMDQNTNNTSVVFCLEWRGYRLLFAGDAERRSWDKMDKAGVLKPVQFEKIGHHGSWNGTPDTKLLDKILPPNSSEGKLRSAVVSTCIEGNYNNVPDEQTLKLFGDRCSRLYRTDKDTSKPGQYVDIEFRA